MPISNELYVNKEEAVLVHTSNQFVYEVSIFCRYKDYFGLIDNKWFTCNREIPKVVKNFYRDSHTEICCELISAPLPWLIDNGYIKYVKPDKKQTIKKVTIKKDGKSKTTIGKSRSWSPTSETNSPRAKELQPL